MIACRTAPTPDCSSASLNAKPKSLQTFLQLWSCGNRKQLEIKSRCLWTREPSEMILWPSLTYYVNFPMRLLSLSGLICFTKMFDRCRPVDLTCTENVLPRTIYLHLQFQKGQQASLFFPTASFCRIKKPCDFPVAIHLLDKQSSANSEMKKTLQQILQLLSKRWRTLQGYGSTGLCCASTSFSY